MVKRYVAEPTGMGVVSQFVAGGASVSRITEVEVVSALWRRSREGSLTAGDRDRLLQTLDRDWPALRVIEVEATVVAEARAMLARHGLRAGDAIQLASALCLRRELGGPVQFVCFDQRLMEAAEREGLLPA